MPVRCEISTIGVMSVIERARGAVGRDLQPRVDDLPREPLDVADDVRTGARQADVGRIDAERVDAGGGSRSSARSSACVTDGDCRPSRSVSSSSITRGGCGRRADPVPVVDQGIDHSAMTSDALLRPWLPRVGRPPIAGADHTGRRGDAAAARHHAAANASRMRASAVLCSCLGESARRRRHRRPRATVQIECQRSRRRRRRARTHGHHAPAVAPGPRYCTTSAVTSSVLLGAMRELLHRFDDAVEQDSPAGCPCVHRFITSIEALLAELVARRRRAPR